MLLTSVIGNISITHGLKLVDLAFPKEYLQDFKGPKFGIDGIRKLLKVPERPMLNNMVKPCTGHTCEVAADLVYQAAVGGCDVVKDDELISNPSFNTLEDRISAVMESIDRADSEKGEKTLYTINITSKFPEMFEYADKMIEMGANALMINFCTAGFEALRAIGVISLLLDEEGQLTVKVPGEFENIEEEMEMKESLLTAQIEAIAANTLGNTGAYPRWIAVKLGFQKYRFLTFRKYQNDYFLSFLSEGNLKE
ncbi:unnamed protein product, partial [marine sediment metagenome]